MLEPWNGIGGRAIHWRREYALFAMLVIGGIALACDIGLVPPDAGPPPPYQSCSQITISSTCASGTRCQRGIYVDDAGPGALGPHCTADCTPGVAACPADRSG